MIRRLADRAAAALLAAVTAVALLAAAGCSGEPSPQASGALRVTASVSFLADIAQNVAGDRFTVESLVPRDADPHAYDPTPRDLARVARSDLLIVNGGGLEGTLEDTVRAAAPGVTVVAASRGLAPRTPRPGEPAAGDDGATQPDPHFWLDPILTIRYVETIRDAFSRADPAGAAEYAAHAAAYAAELRALDDRIRREVAALPAGQRVLVTDHASYGYFADRYGFRVAGSIVPSVATGETPSARELAELTRIVRDERVPAVFVEAGENPQLAEQIAAETDAVVVGDLRDHSLSEPDGDAPTYVAMMEYDARRIVRALLR